MQKDTRPKSNCLSHQHVAVFDESRVDRKLAVRPFDLCHFRQKQRRIDRLQVQLEFVIFATIPTKIEIWTEIAPI